mgnify:FL=1
MVSENLKCFPLKSPLKPRNVIIELVKIKYISAKLSYLEKGILMKAKLLSVLAALALVACATSVTQQEIAQAKFSSQPNQAAIDKEVNTYIKSAVNNPEMATKECSPPRKAWARAIAFEKPKFGWMVVCDVKAKDRSSGDTTMKTYMFLFTADGNYTYDPSSFTNINNNVQFLDLIK